ncbi:hypothetical protein [Priestia megaterium]|uniref:hypothetical protein n=1 Tax=Priestia megaterium TaxID=1404 RepID=UPI0031FCC9B6
MKNRWLQIVGLSLICIMMSIGIFFLFWITAFPKNEEIENTYDKVKAIQERRAAYYKSLD